MSIAEVKRYRPDGTHQMQQNNVSRNVDVFLLISRTENRLMQQISL
jgi:hypothetical protein